MGNNIIEIAQDFPTLDQEVNGKRLIYMDNAATTQKPNCVIETLCDYYRRMNSNIHRGTHYLAMEATEAFEETRARVRDFIHARRNHEIVFTRGTTESINLVASSFGKRYLREGDEVIITRMEHHSNIVPWQMACEEKGAKVRAVDIDASGALKKEQYETLINERTRLIAVTYVSNTLGTINPIAEISQMAHEKGIPVLVDGAQAMGHIEVDVQALGCDFLCFSGHKMYGPMGVGILYGREELLEELPPYQGGGEMIKEVTIEKTTYNELPYKFEAGTPSVGDVIGMRSAIDYIEKIGIEVLHRQETLVYNTIYDKLKEMAGVKIYGEAAKKASILSFNLSGAHPYDVGTLLDKLGIAVRTGHHCTQPIMDSYGIPGTVRASFGAYNTVEEAEQFVGAIERIATMLQ